MSECLRIRWDTKQVQDERNFHRQAAPRHECQPFLSLFRIGIRIRGSESRKPHDTRLLRPTDSLRDRILAVCGIAGCVGEKLGLSVEQMIAAMRHRGPDEVGTWSCPQASLGMSRLAIIDVQEGHQPFFSMDESVVAIGNGEIYNHLELAHDLKRQGIHLRSGSDMEVIPHLYRRYGLEFVQRLRGMFALALWDRSSEELILVRDRVGKKPLVYAESNGGLVFASEARALLAAGWRGTPDFSSLNHLLAFGYMAPDSSAYSGLRSIPPAHVGVWDGTGLRLERYWNWSLANDPLGMPGLAERTQETIQEAVDLRLVSERPIGAWLSGGIDSTVVTALMTRSHAGPVRTFSIGFPESGFDESMYARGVAAFLGTQHEQLIVEPHPTELLSELAATFDQPLADSSAIPTMLLSRMTAKRVVVALSGDGGDEAFGGYERYVAALLLQKLNPLWRAASPIHQGLRDRTRGRVPARVSRVLQEMIPMQDLGARYLRMMQYLPEDFRARLWSQAVQESVDIGEPERRMALRWQDSSTLTPISRMRALDAATYLPGDLLNKVDTTSMACSVEVRSPLLDQEVLALAARLPQEAMVRGRTTKWLLREVAYRLVPRELIDRPKKGFGIPRAAWLRGPLREMSHDLLLDPTARQRGWFDPGIVRRLLDSHDQGDDRDLFLWPILITELWARRWLDQRANLL